MVITGDLPSRSLTEPAVTWPNVGQSEDFWKWEIPIQWLVNLHWATWRKNRSLVVRIQNQSKPIWEEWEKQLWKHVRGWRDESLKSDGEKRRETCFREVGGLFRIWVTFTAFGASPSEPGCTPEPVILGPDIKSFFPVLMILRRNCN